MVRLVRFPGLQPYGKIMEFQSQLVHAKFSNRQECPDYLLLLEHEPVITLGRRSHSQTLTVTIPTFASNRGGQVTYHGPGQLVAYPILDLLRYRQSLLWYTETLASVMSDAVKTVCKLDAYFDKCPDRVGLWFSQNEKLGFIGIQAQRWIVSHGCSINLSQQACEGFNEIDPCGLGKNINIVSCEGKSGIRASREQYENAFIQSFQKRFNCSIEE